MNIEDFLRDPFVRGFSEEATMPHSNQKHPLMRRILNESRFPVKLIDFMISEIKFDSGEIMSSPGARHTFKTSGDNPTFYLWRHLCGDCGEAELPVCNDKGRSVEQNAPMVSCYRLRNGALIWCITDAPRLTTAFVMHEEIGSI